MYKYCNISGMMLKFIRRYQSWALKRTNFFTCRSDRNKILRIFW